MMAAPFTSVRAVFDSLGIDSVPKTPAAAISYSAAAVLELLGEGARGIDELTREAGSSSAEVAAALVELELAGLAAQADGVYRVLSPGRRRVVRTAV